MGNDMFNDEQLKHAEILQKETEDALGFWKDRALKAEAKLADKYLIEEQYETACGDRDGLLRMVETLREQKTALEAERDALLSRPAPPADAATEAVLSRIESACGHPDPAEACRNVLALCREARVWDREAAPSQAYLDEIEAALAARRGDV